MPKTIEERLQDYGNQEWAAGHRGWLSPDTGAEYKVAITEPWDAAICFNAVIRRLSVTHLEQWVVVFVLRGVLHTWSLF